MKGLMLLILVLLLPVLTFAQNNRIINTHNWAYVYVKRLQQRGYLHTLNPTDLPYKTGEVRKALQQVNKAHLSPLELRWYSLLIKAFEKRESNVGEMRVGGLFKGGAVRSSSERLNTLQPLGNGKPLLPYGQLNAYLEWDRWIGQAGVTFNWFYDVDPDGLDMGRRLYMRSEEAYFGYNGEMLDLYIGRFNNHWSVFGRQGAFLTDNPRSFDQLQFRFGNSKLSFQSILGELDNMGANGVFSGHNYELGAFRRYLFLHRLDWSPVPNFKLTFIEGELYFSETASISLRNLMPLHFLFFESHNAPMNNNSNLLIGGSIWYQTGKFTFFFQGMLDDLVVENRDGLRENNRLIPTVYTINSSIVMAGIGDNFDLGLEADLVSANSYRSNRYQDQWTYAQRGLATAFSDYIRTKIYAAFYPRWIQGLTLKPAFTVYHKGIGDFRSLRTSTTPNGEQIDGILSGTVERTLRPSVYIRYQQAGFNLFGPGQDVRFSFWMDADIGFNFITNTGHIEGVTDRRFIGLFRLNGQVTF